MGSSTFAKACAAALAFLVRLAFAHPQDLPRQQVLERDNQDPNLPTTSPGENKPQGWLKGEMQLEAEGLAGNMFDFYRYVHDSMWLGGTSEYSALHESAPYWFNGLVPLAFSLADTRLQDQVKTFLDYILDNQAEDGWLGPETTPQTRGLWGRCYILLGLIQYVDADDSQAARVVNAMHRYVQLAHSMLKDNFTGLIPKEGDQFDSDGFGLARAHEMHIPLIWLYESYPRNNSQLILETLDLMIEGNKKANVDWRDFWVEGVYPDVVYAPREQSYSWLFTHAVNMAEGLRFPLSIYLTTKDETLKTQTRTAVDLLAKWHKSLSGTIIGDEFITDLNPSRGAELCTTAEIMFSLAIIYQYIGGNDLADWVELAAYNALPGQMSPDWWSHQYVQQENQPWSRNLTEKPEMWQNVGSHGNVFGLEPNYPCCTVNHPQAYPKFLANSYSAVEDGFAHVLLGPSSLNTSAPGAETTIVADTIYPFGLDINYVITSSYNYSFYVRIPDWASSSSTYTTSSGEASKPISPSDQQFQKFDITEGTSAISINFHTEPRVEYRANNTAAIYYGPLLFSLAIDFNESVVEPWAYDGSGPLDSSTTNNYTHDHIIEPTGSGPWNIAIDLSQIRVVQRTATSEDLPSPIWAYGAPPVELRVAAVEIDWPLAFDSPADPPSDPKITGKPFSARFVPFGSAKIHMAHLPVVQLEEVDLS